MKTMKQFLNEAMKDVDVNQPSMKLSNNKEIWHNPVDKTFFIKLKQGDLRLTKEEAKKIMNFIKSNL